MTSPDSGSPSQEEAPLIRAPLPPVEPTRADTVAPRTRPSASKWLIVVVVVLALTVFLGCCGAFAALSMVGSDPTATFGDTVAVLHVDGVIAGTGSSIDGVISPEEFLSYLDQAASDPNVKAVLLRVDSPGGTVAASQEIAIEVARLSEIKPVVVSVGDVGASGAYMVASQCDKIWANRTSAIGSIGVITEIPNVEGLLDKLGVEFTVLTAGEYKDAGSPFRSLTATETAMIQTEVDVAYDEFVSMVAEGRGMDEAEVRELATGWAWSGVRARELGLVDELGTYNDALDDAADLGGIEGDYSVISYDQTDYMDLVYSLIGIRDSLARIGALSPAISSPTPVIPR